MTFSPSLHQPIFGAK